MQNNLRKWAVTLLCTNFSYIMWWIKIIAAVILLVIIKMIFF